MAWGEPAWKTTQRDQEMQQQFPELQYASPEELMQFDNYRVTSGTGAVSDYSAGVMQLAAYAAEQERKRQEEAARSGPMPEGVDAGSMNPQPLYPTGTQENGPMPAEVDQGRNFTPFDQPADPYGAAAMALPGVTNGAYDESRFKPRAEAQADSYGPGGVIKGVAQGLNGSLLTNQNGLPGPLQDALNMPVVGDLLREATKPTTWMAAAALPFAQGADFLTNVGINAASLEAGKLAVQEAQPYTSQLPGPLPQIADAGIGMIASGGTGVGLAHAVGPALEGLGNAALGYRNATEHIPIPGSAVVNDVSGEDLGALMAKVEQEGGFNADTIAKYQEITGRRPTASMTRPEESIAPPGVPGSRTAEDMIQGAGNAIVKNQGAADINLSNRLPLLRVMDALDAAESVAPEQAANVRALRSRQAGAFAGVAERGGGREGFKQAAGAMRGAAEQASYTPLSSTIDSEAQDALYNQILGTDTSPFTRRTAGDTLGKLLDGQPITKSGLKAFGDIFGAEAHDQIAARLTKLGGFEQSNLWQDITEHPIASVNNSLRSTHTLLDVAFMGRLGPTAGLYDAETYTKSIAQAWKSVGDQAVVDRVLTNVDARAAESGFLPDIQTMREAGLRFGAGTIADERTGYVGKVPVLGRLTRVYGNFSTVLRPQMMQHTVENMVNAGRITAEQANDPAVLQDIARGINNISGAANSTFLRNPEGTASLLLQFPNWFMSQFELVGSAFQRGTLSGNMARQALTRTMLLGTGLAAGVNLAQGINPLDHVKNGVPQMVIPGTNGFTLDPYGPIGELVRHVIGVGRKTYEGGTPDGFAGKVDFAGAAGGGGHELGQWGRGLVSPLIGIGIDLLTGSNYVGDKTRDTRADTLNYLGRAVGPFGVSEIGQKDPRAIGLSSLGLRGVHEPNTTEKLDQITQQGGYKDLQGKPVTSFYDLGPKERDDILKAHPDLQQAKADHATDTTKAGNDVRAKAFEQQQGIDDQLKAALAKHDPKAQQNWQDATSSLRDRTEGALGQVYKDSPQKQPDPTKPWEMYSKIIADNTDPVSNKVDWNAVDTWRSGLDATQEAALERETGLHSTPYQAERRAAMNALDKAGYFDVMDKAWAEAQQAAPAQFGQFKTEDDYRASIDAMIRQQLPAGINPNSPEADIFVAQAESKMGILQKLAQFDGQHSAQWQMSNPQLAKQAIEYGILNPAHIKRSVAGGLIGR